MAEGDVSVADIFAAFNGSAVAFVMPFVFGGKLVFSPGAEADAGRALAPGVNDR